MLGFWAVSGAFGCRLGPWSEGRSARRRADGLVLGSLDFGSPSGRSALASPRRVLGVGTSSLTWFFVWVVEHYAQFEKHSSLEVPPFRPYRGELKRVQAVSVVEAGG